MEANPRSKRSYVALITPLATVVLMALLSQTEFVRHWENVTMDRRFRDRAETDPPPDPRIALIGIGDQSIKRLRWNDWTRDLHGEFCAALTYRPPKVLAFDFFFPDESKITQHDEIFSDSLSFHESAITGMVIDVDAPESTDKEASVYLGKSEPLPNIDGDQSKILGGGDARIPIPIIADSSWTGVVNCPPSKIDGMRRWLPLIGRVGKNVYPSLVLRILMQMEGASSEDVEIRLAESIRIPKAEGGEWSIPIDERGFLAINYRDTKRLELNDYLSVFAQLAKHEDRDTWPKELPPLTDQIVLVGQSAAGLPDLGPTPYNQSDPLFRVQATGLDNILSNDYLRFISPIWIAAGWLALAWITLFLLKEAPVVAAIGVPVVIATAYGFAAYAVFEKYSLALPIVLPILGFGIIHATMFGDRLYRESRARKHIHTAFGTYMTKTLVDKIAASGEMPELGGEKVEITVLFSDIQGFSAFSEALTPERLVEVMVEYLSELTDLVLDVEGTLDKYIGDAIDAMFGAPIPYPDHAYRAVACTIAMQKMQEELCERWKKDATLPEKVHNMRTRIGLNSGEAVVGNIGSRRRFNYTMMGDNVNLGARCESGAKSYGVYTMITGDTRKAAMETKDDVCYRYLDKIVVQGRSLPVKVYEVIGYHSEVSSETKQCLDIFAKAIEAYLEQDWMRAQELFQEASRFEFFQPDRDHGVSKNPSIVMADRCLEMKANPPGEDWDGVYTMTTK